MLWGLGVVSGRRYSGFLFLRAMQKIFTPYEQEQRKFSRIPCRLGISIKKLANFTETSATTFDISPGGIGIETEHGFRIGEKIELWIHFNDGLKPVHRFGKLIWIEEMNTKLYRGGIRFESERIRSNGNQLLKS